MQKIKINKKILIFLIQDRDLFTTLLFTKGPDLLICYLDPIWFWVLALRMYIHECLLSDATSFSLQPNLSIVLRMHSAFETMLGAENVNSTFLLLLFIFK